jgi:hypothetical protein
VLSTYPNGPEIVSASRSSWRLRRTAAHPLEFDIRERTRPLRWNSGTAEFAATLASVLDPH